MHKQIFTEETYGFKKAMRAYVREKISPLLRENGFVRYGTIKYVREKDGLAQIILVRIAKYEVEIFAYYLPVFYPGDYVLNFGINMTGTNGIYLLEGKYWTTIYEPEKLNRSIQFQNYRTIHIQAMEKVYNAIREGIIPEMNRINSFEIFVSKLKEKEINFFGNRHIGEFRNGFTFRFIMAVDECINGDIKAGIQNLSEIETEIQNISEIPKLLPDDDINSVIKILLNTDSCKEITKEIFNHRLEQLCDERRKKYRLKK